MMLCCLCCLRQHEIVVSLHTRANYADDSSVMLLGKYTTDRFNYMPGTNTFHLVPSRPQTNLIDIGGNYSVSADISNTFFDQWSKTASISTRQNRRYQRHRFDRRLFHVDQIVCHRRQCRLPQCRVVAVCRHGRRAFSRRRLEVCEEVRCLREPFLKS